MVEQSTIIKVAAIDESELVLHGWQAVLQAEPGIELVFTATSVAGVVDELRRGGVHGVIFAAGTSRRDTIARCEQLRGAVGPNPFLCLLSPTADEQLLFDVTHVGVQGFLVRDIPVATIGSAIRHLAEGECYVDPGLAATLFELVRTKPDQVLEQLSPTERAILSRLGEGLSNAEIAQQVFLSEKTVRNYISRLLRKLDLATRADAVAFGARGARRGLDERLLQLR